MSQQLVHFKLADRIPSHQALADTDLIVPIVVNMHPWIGTPTLIAKLNKLHKGLTLLIVIVSPALPKLPISMIVQIGTAP